MAARDGGIAAMNQIEQYKISVANLNRFALNKGMFFPFYVGINVERHAHYTSADPGDAATEDLFELL